MCHKLATPDRHMVRNCTVCLLCWLHGWPKSIYCCAFWRMKYISCEALWRCAGHDILVWPLATSNPQESQMFQLEKGFTMFENAG